MQARMTLNIFSGSKGWNTVKALLSEKYRNCQ